MLPFGYLLHRLTAHLLPIAKAHLFAQLQQMPLPPRQADIATCHTIVATLKGYHMIPDHPGAIYPLLQVLVAPVVVQAILVGFSDLHFPF